MARTEAFLSGASRPRSSPFVVAAAVSLSLLGDALLYAVLPSQAPALGIPLTLVGVLLSANRMIRFVTNSWAAAVYARRDRPGPFLAAMVGATATTLSYAAPWGFWPFLVSRALWGTCWSFLRLGQMLAVLEWASPGDRGHWVGRVQALARVGTIFALLAGGYLTDRIGYRTTVLLFGALTAAGAAVAWWDLVHGRPKGRYERGDASAAPAEEVEENQLCNDGGQPEPTVIGRGEGARPADAQGHRLRRTERPRLVLTYLAGFAQGFTTFGIVMGTLALLLLQRFGEDVTLMGARVGVATLSGWLLGGRWIIELLLAPGSGRLADCLGRGQSVALGALLQAGMLAALALAASVGAVAAAALGLFAAAVVFSISLDALAADLAAHERSTGVLSRYNTAQDLGAALGPALGYTLTGTIGLPATYLGAAGLLVFIAALFAGGHKGSQLPLGGPRRLAT